MNTKISCLFLIMVLVSTPMILTDVSACTFYDITCLLKSDNKKDNTSPTKVIPENPISTSIKETVKSNSKNIVTDYTNIKNEIGTLKNDLESITFEIKTLTSTLKSLTTKMDELKSDMNTEIISDFKETKNAISALKSDVKSDFENTKNEMTTLSTDMTSKIIYVSNEIDSLKDSVGNVEKSVESIEKSIVSKVSKNINSLKNDITSIETSIIDEIKKDVYTVDKDFQIVEDTLKSVEQTVVNDIKSDVKIVKESTITIAKDVKYGFEKTEWFFTDIVEPIMIKAGDIIVPLFIFLFDVLKTLVQIIEFLFDDWDLVRYVLIYGTIGLIFTYIGYRIFMFVKSMQGYHREKLLVQHISKQTLQNEKMISLLENMQVKQPQ